MSSIRAFENKPPLHRRKKEIIILILIGLAALLSIFFYSYIVYSPAQTSNYHRINILCDEKIEREEYSNCTFELVSKNSEYNIRPMNALIKLQGMTNAKLPKKGYRLELSDRVSLLGMRKDDDWVLFALYLDYPRMRIKLSFDLWRSLEDLNPTAILPNSEYVSVYLNGEFIGLYLLAEKNDRRLFDLDDAQNNLDTSFILQAKSYEVFKQIDYIGWQQDWPNEDDGIYIKNEILYELVTFINNTSDEEFYDSETGVYSRFDKLNLIDFFLYNYFQVHTDFWSNNFYIVRNTNPSKIFLVPWDFDGSFGQKGNQEYSATDNATSLIKKVNGLYNRLLNNSDFREDCKIRWNYLRENLWTDEYIIDELSNIYKDIQDILAVEVLIWKDKIEKRDEGEEFIIEDYINNLFKWIPERLDFCDSYFAEF
ncbi:MAG: CotH kinase family protein [Candidatus Hermodarchaeota archaeon]